MLALKKLITSAHYSGGSYLYLAPENRVAEKASFASAGFLWITNKGLAPINITLISPSLILGKNLMSMMKFSAT